MTELIQKIDEKYSGSSDKNISFDHFLMYLMAMQNFGGFHQNNAPSQDNYSATCQSSKTGNFVSNFFAIWKLMILIARLTNLVMISYKVAKKIFKF